MRLLQLDGSDSIMLLKRLFASIATIFRPRLLQLLFFLLFGSLEHSLQDSEACFVDLFLPLKLFELHVNFLLDVFSAIQTLAWRFFKELINFLIRFVFIASARVVRIDHILLLEVE